MRTLICHCTACQKMTGSSFFAESMFSLGAVEFTGAQMNCYAHVSDTSGRRVFLHFCPTCATTVTLTFERWPEYRAIARGTFDQPNRMDVTAHIWLKSAQSGIALPSNIDCYARARISLDGEPELPQRFDAPQSTEAVCSVQGGTAAHSSPS
ncbi:GFA family protein [Ramlibacter sp. AN1015]|uniref:GFA family protein n=1 Tax=Ramlibacter sp. AN1015 TaxID=3133428 RepID=UPI0030BD3746